MGEPSFPVHEEDLVLVFVNQLQDLSQGHTHLFHGVVYVQDAVLGHPIRRRVMEHVKDHAEDVFLAVDKIVQVAQVDSRGPGYLPHGGLGISFFDKEFRCLPSDQKLLFPDEFLCLTLPLTSPSADLLVDVFLALMCSPDYCFIITCIKVHHFVKLKTRPSPRLGFSLPCRVHGRGESPHPGVLLFHEPGCPGCLRPEQRRSDVCLPVWPWRRCCSRIWR